MNEVLFTVLQCIVAISTILIMRYVLPYLRMKLNAVISAEVFDEILKQVKSVEQDKDFVFGALKKDEVIARILEWANNKGINITEKQISNLIETAVWVMKNEDNLNG